MRGVWWSSSSQMDRGVAFGEKQGVSLSVLMSWLHSGGEGEGEGWQWSWTWEVWPCWSDWLESPQDETWR